MGSEPDAVCWVCLPDWACSPVSGLVVHQICLNRFCLIWGGGGTLPGESAQFTQFEDSSLGAYLSLSLASAYKPWSSNRDGLGSGVPATHNGRRGLNSWLLALAWLRHNYSEHLGSEPVNGSAFCFWFCASQTKLKLKKKKKKKKKTCAAGSPKQPGWDQFRVSLSGTFCLHLWWSSSWLLQVAEKPDAFTPNNPTPSNLNCGCTETRSCLWICPL